MAVTCCASFLQKVTNSTFAGGLPLPKPNAVPQPPSQAPPPAKPPATDETRAKAKAGGPAGKSGFEAKPGNSGKLPGKTHPPQGKPVKKDKIKIELKCLLLRTKFLCSITWERLRQCIRTTTAGDLVNANMETLAGGTLLLLSQQIDVLSLFLNFLPTCHLLGGWGRGRDGLGLGLGSNEKKYLGQLGPEALG